MEEDWGKIDTDPGAVRAKAYDIVLNGTELGGGSVRIHQADIQAKMFEVLGFTPEQAREQFGFLLDAFKFGVPSSRRTGLRPGPGGHAYGRGGQYPGRHRVPQGQGRLLSDVGRAGNGGGKAA